MGFKRKNKVYKLDFAGTEYEGLEVTLRGLSTGEYLDLVGLSAPGNDGAETEGMIRMMAEHLVSWNLEDDKGPVPTTYEAVKESDLDLNLTIVSAWTTAIGDVPEETGKNSTSGGTTQVELIPTETL